MCTQSDSKKALKPMPADRDDRCAIPDPAVHTKTGRDPEDRPVNSQSKEHVREKMLDKTIADSFPTSDPPSSIPNPSEDDSLAA
jgi:hypothetical protein